MYGELLLQLIRLTQSISLNTAWSAATQHCGSLRCGTATRLPPGMRGGAPQVPSGHTITHQVWEQHSHDHRHRENPGQE